jgi:hypothetical protein
LLDKREKRGIDFFLIKTHQAANYTRVFKPEPKKQKFLIFSKKPRDKSAMKLTFSVLIALVASDPVVKTDRKVPPKHPRNRLARLNLFCDYLFNKTQWIKETRTGGLIRLCNKWSSKMEEKVEGSDCFFYDPNQKPHGGPEPGVEPAPPKSYHENWDTGLIDWRPAQRRRRSVDASCYRENPYANEDGEPDQVQTCDASRDDYMHPNWFDESIMAEIENELCQDDCDENNDCKDECHLDPKDVRGSGDKKIQRLLKQGPWKGARSILTGFRKFGERYLSQCHGHRKGTHMHKRTQFIIRVSKKFLTHCEHEQCSHDYLDSKKFKWGKKNLRTDYHGRK